MRVSSVLLLFQCLDALSSWHERPDSGLLVRLGSTLFVLPFSAMSILQVKAKDLIPCLIPPLN
jgi:hypothetical protein